MRRLAIIVVVLTATAVVGPACIGSGDGSGKTQRSAVLREFPLESLATSAVAINGHVFRVWLALTEDEQTEGLMHVSAAEIADDQGMLFVFPEERLRGFWMKNTITPLDIAYTRMDGTIVQTWTMVPLTLETYPSIEPAMFALEVKAGTFARLGIRVGDRLVIPPEVFKTSP